MKIDDITVAEAGEAAIMAAEVVAVSETAKVRKQLPQTIRL